MPIPKVVHRIWLDDPMPETFAGYGERLRALHPGWELRDWRSSDELPWSLFHNGHLIRSAQEVFPADWQRFQADLLRLELLWLHGGVYVDCDVEPLRPFDPLCAHEAFVPFSPNRGPKSERLLTQCVLGARPHHPFIGACLQAVPEAVDQRRGKPLAQVVGPWMVTRVWESQKWHDLLVFPEQTFGPQSIRDRDRGKPADTSESFGHHHWNSSARRRGKGAT